MAKNKQGGQVIHLKSTESGHMYHTKKNKKKHPARMELKKFDPLVGRKVTYRETKGS
jgi:large subunit ribosomal protein L33